MAKTLLLTLRTFSATGGIEKVCRILGKALYEQAMENNGRFEICSMYDSDKDAENNEYFPALCFKGYEVSKLKYFMAMLAKGRIFDTVIMSHINLLPIGWMIKKISPSTKIILLAHGIEIWDKVGERKRKMLQTCDVIAAVSSYTRDKVIQNQQVSPEKCVVLNNCLDPYLPIPSVIGKTDKLLSKYGFEKTDKILMTLTRLSSRERYKGYDNVIEAMGRLGELGANVKYLIAGSYDQVEKKYLENHIQKLGLTGRVVMSGYVMDEELEAHFALADIYIMPSRKEGFGIVFIEAMYYGLPVIAGNKDGSVDALLNGQLGELVNPDNIPEISQALTKYIIGIENIHPNQQLLQNNFGYKAYKAKLNVLLSRN